MKWAYSDYYDGKNVGDEKNENIVAERKSLKPDIVYKLKGKVKNWYIIPRAETCHAVASNYTIEFCVIRCRTQ